MPVHPCRQRTAGRPRWPGLCRWCAFDYDTVPVASDLPAEVFRVLRRALLGPDGQPRKLWLRPKAQTQDDPFDERIAELLGEAMPAGVKIVRAAGPLITPDL